MPAACESRHPPTSSPRATGAVNEFGVFFVARDVLLCVHFPIRNELVTLARLERPLEDWTEWPDEVRARGYNADDAARALVERHGGELIESDHRSMQSEIPEDGRTILARFRDRWSGGSADTSDEPDEAPVGGVAEGSPVQGTR
jgi:hypothetical protein